MQLYVCVWVRECLTSICVGKLWQTVSSSVCVGLSLHISTSSRSMSPLIRRPLATRPILITPHSTPPLLGSLFKRIINDREHSHFMCFFNSTHFNVTTSLFFNKIYVWSKAVNNILKNFKSNIRLYSHQIRRCADSPAFSLPPLPLFVHSPSLSLKRMDTNQRKLLRIERRLQARHRHRKITKLTKRGYIWESIIVWSMNSAWIAPGFSYISGWLWSILTLIAGLLDWALETDIGLCYPKSWFRFNFSLQAC